MSLAIDFIGTSSRFSSIRARENNSFLPWGIGGICLQLAGLFLIGSQPTTLFCLLVIDVGCLLLILHHGHDATALTIVVALGFHVTAAAVIKLLIGQPLEENLLVPDTTFAIETIYFLALVAAFYAVKAVKLPALVDGHVLDPDLLRLIAITTTVAGLGATLIFTAQNAEIGQQYGEVDSASAPLAVAFRGFGTLGLVCCAARAVLVSNRNRILDSLSLPILAASVIVGLSTNSREGVAAPIVAFVVSGIAFGYRPKLSTMIAGAIFAVVFVNYVSPALVLTRDQRDVLGPIERTAYALDVVGDLVLDTPKGQEYRAQLTFNEGISLGRYFGVYNTIADRVALVQTVDAVANGIQTSTNLDYDDLPNIFETLLPEIVTNLFGFERRAVAVPVGDLVAWTAGISPFGWVSFLAIPESAEAYAVDGFAAVAYRTFAVYALSFAALYLSSGTDLRRNILAVTLFLMFFHTASGGVSSALYYFSLRILPQFVISYVVVVRICKLMTKHRTV